MVGAGQRPGARQRRGVDHLAGAEGRRPARRSVGDRDGGHAPERDGVPVAPEVGEGDLLQGREHERCPVAGRGPAGGAAQAADEVGAAGDDAGLRPAEQLVAGEGHERRRRRARSGGRPARRASQAGGPSGSHGQAASSSPEPMSCDDRDGRAPRARRRRHGLGEALDRGSSTGAPSAPARRRRPAIDGALVVGQAGAVGGADLDEPGAGLLAAPRARGSRRRSRRISPRRHDHVATARPARRATSSTAAALLLTTIAASAPHSRASSRPTWSCREPRRPVSRSSSRFQ